MNGKFLGKITNAEFGTYPDRPFLMGLQLTFSFDGSATGCGGRYTINIGENCKWDSEEQKASFFIASFNTLNDILKDAKVNHVSQLKNKPVEIEIDGNMFKDFRILTEVL